MLIICSCLSVQSMTGNGRLLCTLRFSFDSSVDIGEDPALEVTTLYCSYCLYIKLMTLIASQLVPVVCFFWFSAGFSSCGLRLLNFSGRMPSLLCGFGRC